MVKKVFERFVGKRVGASGGLVLDVVEGIVEVGCEFVGRFVGMIEGFDDLSFGELGAT